MAKTLNKPVRLADIAEAADVSVSTVSLAFSDHPRIRESTKRRLRQLGRELGYRRPGESRQNTPRKNPTPALSGKAGRRFGCLLLSSSLRDEIYVELLEGLMACATDLDARVELGSVAADLPNDEGLDQAIQFADRLDGVLISGMVSAQLLSMLDDMRLPHVVMGRMPVDPADPLPNPTRLVSHDEIAMGRCATRSLFRAGHERVAFICETAPKHLWSDRWLTGYRMAHVDVGRPCDERLVRADIPLYSATDAVIEQLFASPASRPTAFVIPDARVAKSISDALDRRGIDYAPDAIVVGCSVDMARNHQVTAMGRIQTDPGRLARVALKHLAGVCDTAYEESLEIIVPFTTHNLPAAAPAGDAQGRTAEGRGAVVEARD